MRGLVPRIHVFRAAAKAWMAGTSPAMTEVKIERRRRDALASSVVARMSEAISRERPSPDSKRNPGYADAPSAARISASARSGATNVHSGS
jgi:hypothetical protein